MFFFADEDELAGSGANAGCSAGESYDGNDGEMLAQEATEPAVMTPLAMRSR